MTEALKVFEQVQVAAKANEANLRFIKSIDIGQGIRQGDVCLYRRAGISKSERAKLKPWQGGLQLAIGSTRGSRHMLEEGTPVVLYQHSVRGESAEFAGPIVEAPERFTVTHPDHAHFSLPSGTYETRYHRDLATERRVQD